MGGCILCDEAFFEDHLNQYLRHTGPTQALNGLMLGPVCLL
ncbi:MAG: hypothetical protein AAFW60_12350 [Pseudomonadota bacterium]